MNRALQIGTPLGYGVDSGLADPGTKKLELEQHFHLIPSDG
jgi:hypothetical protein